MIGSERFDRHGEVHHHGPRIGAAAEGVEASVVSPLIETGVPGRHRAAQRCDRAAGISLLSNPATGTFTLDVRAFARIRMETRSLLFPGWSASNFVTSSASLHHGNFADRPVN